VEVRIGIPSVSRELLIETASTPEEVESALRAAVAAGTGVFILTNAKGGKVLVPADKIGYVELGGTEPRWVGFGNSRRATS
jgi:phosphatidylserine/phosphatidylglycerophosphate/cardiolipin synthase-like enzyme